MVDTTSAAGVVEGAVVAGGLQGSNHTLEIGLGAKGRWRNDSSLHADLLVVACLTEGDEYESSRAFLHESTAVRALDVPGREIS